MKICPSVLIVWPLNADYPICRYNLARFKDYFSSIWIAFSDHHQEVNLSNFIRHNLPFASFVEFERTRPDWRDDAVNNLLDKTKDEKYILFMEQDFLIKDGSFFEKVFKDDHDFLYFMEGSRMHPAFACVKRELIDKTSKDFSAFPPGDHFYKFFNELPEGKNIDELGVADKEDYYHMAGITQNMMSFKYGDTFFKPNNFLVYNRLSMNIPVPQHPLFNSIQQQIENRFGHPKTHIFLERFFPNSEDVL